MFSITELHLHNKMISVNQNLAKKDLLMITLFLHPLDNEDYNDFFFKKTTTKSTHTKQVNKQVH